MIITDVILLKIYPDVVANEIILDCVVVEVVPRCVPVDIVAKTVAGVASSPGIRSEWALGDVQVRGVTNQVVGQVSELRTITDKVGRIHPVLNVEVTPNVKLHAQDPVARQEPFMVGSRVGNSSDARRRTQHEAY